MKTYRDIVRMKKELLGLYIERDLLRLIETCVVGHKGNAVELEMRFNNCRLFSTYDMKHIYSEVLKIIVESLDLSVNEGFKLSEVKNKPVRTVCEKKNGKIIGFGCLSKDKFVLADDVIEIAQENAYEQLKFIKLR